MFCCLGKAKSLRERERESINFEGEGCKGWREQWTPKTSEKKNRAIKQTNQKKKKGEKIKGERQKRTPKGDSV